MTVFGPTALGCLSTIFWNSLPRLRQLVLIDVDPPEQVVGAHVRGLDVDRRPQLLLGRRQVLGGDVDARREHEQVAVLGILGELCRHPVAAALDLAGGGLDRGESGERVELFRILLQGRLEMAPRPRLILLEQQQRAVDGADVRIVGRPRRQGGELRLGPVDVSLGEQAAHQQQLRGRVAGGVDQRVPGELHRRVGAAGRQVQPGERRLCGGGPRVQLQDLAEGGLRFVVLPQRRVRRADEVLRDR